MQLPTHSTRGLLVGALAAPLLVVQATDLQAQGATGASISPDGSYIAACDHSSNEVRFYSSTSPVPVWTADLHALYVATADNGHVAVSEHGDEVFLFDSSGKQIWNYSDAKWSGHDSLRVSMSDAGDVLAAVNDDPSDSSGSILCAFDDGGDGWDTGDGSPSCTYTPSPDVGGNDFYAVTVSGSGLYSATGPAKGTYWLDSTCTETASYSVGTIQSLDFTTDELYLAAGNRAGDVYLLDSTGLEVWSDNIGGIVQTVGAASYGGPLGDATIAAGNDQGDLAVYDVSGSLLWSVSFGQKVASLDISDDGQYIAVGVLGQELTFYHRDIGATPLWSHPIPVASSGAGWMGTESRSVSVSQDAELIVAACKDGLYVFKKDGTLHWTDGSSGFGEASALKYCGTGYNIPCDGFWVTQPPVLGGTFEAFVSGACHAQAVGGMIAYTQPWSLMSPWGEMLVLPSPPQIYNLASPGDPAFFVVPIPPLPMLLGYTFYTQGYGFGVGGDIVLHCAYEATIGY